MPGFEAPIHVSWARNNRSRADPGADRQAGQPDATRIEYRSPDPACNPYLAFAVILAAGLKGIAEGYELPAEADANLFEIADEVLAKLGIEPLPQSLPTRSRRWSSPSSSPRPSASTSSSGSCATSGAVWLDRGELDKIIDRAANTLAGSTPACGTGAHGAGASTAATPTGATSPRRRTQPQAAQAQLPRRPVRLRLSGQDSSAVAV